MSFLHLAMLRRDQNQDNICSLTEGTAEKHVVLYTNKSINDQMTHNEEFEFSPITFTLLTDR